MYELLMQNTFQPQSCLPVLYFRNSLPVSCALSQVTEKCPSSLQYLQVLLMGSRVIQPRDEEDSASQLCE